LANLKLNLNSNRQEIKGFLEEKTLSKLNSIRIKIIVYSPATKMRIELENLERR